MKKQKSVVDKQPRRGRLRPYGGRERTVRYGPQPGFGVTHAYGERIAAALHDMPAGAGRLLLAVIFDGVLVAEELPLAWKALRRPYGTSDGVAIEWTREDGWLERRFLGMLTVLTLEAAKTPFDAAVDELCHYLVGQVDDRSGEASSRIDLDVILAAVSARLSTVLATDLYAHVVGDRRLAALPTSCLARQTSRQALVLDLPSRSSETEALLRQCEKLDCFEGATDLGDHEVRRLIRLATTVPSESRDAVRQRETMRNRLLDAEPIVETASPAMRLLWMWTLGLIEHGSEQKGKLAPSTISQYIHVALDPLAEALSTVVISNNAMATIEWTRLTAEAAKTPNVYETQRGKLCAAIDSFRHFLERRFHLSPLERLETAGVVAAVKANLVLPHEKEWIFQQLAAGATDDRYGQQLVAAFALFSDTGLAMRTQDIGHIHIAGVPLAEHGSVVVIDPLRHVGRGKTGAARRSVRLREPHAQEILHRWRERREREGARPSDLLFAAPDNGFNVFQLPRMLDDLLRLLKAATGDPTTCLHDLRHTNLTYARAEADAIGQRKFDERSAQAGHQDPAMTLERYVHAHELLLRRQLDSYWTSQHLSERQACALLAIPMGRLRQQRHRASPHAMSNGYWTAIKEAAGAVTVDSVCIRFDLRPPVPPVFEDRVSFGLPSLLEFLTQSAGGLDVEAARLRFDIGDAVWFRIRQALRQWDALQRRRRRGRSTPPQSSANVPFAKGFGHLNQPKLASIIDAMLRRTDVAALTAATEAWSDALFSKWISLDQPRGLRPLMDWLAAAGVKAGQLVICHDRDLENEVLVMAKQLALPFGWDACRTMPLAQRAGRPPFYLGFIDETLVECSDPLANAAISVEGLNAAMLAAWLWLRVPNTEGGGGAA